MGALRPDREPEDVLAALAEAGVTGGHTVLVGHQPLLGVLAASLTGQAAPALAPGGLVRIEFGGPPAMGSGSLGWRVGPDTLA